MVLPPRANFLTLISSENFISPFVKNSSLLSCFVFSKTINVKILKGFP
jgi:hypothetical protein